MPKKNGTKAIDLNADVGEGCKNDALLMDYISSANIACGAHAGDADTMALTIRIALKKRVAIGAHPGFADRQHFGRRTMSLSDDELIALVCEQLDTLQKFATQEGGIVHHIKPHGALYTLTATDSDVAKVFIDACQIVIPNATIIGLAGRELTTHAAHRALPYLREGFIDRRYHSSSELVARSSPGAIIEHPELVAKQSLQLATALPITTASGTNVCLLADTLCLHGDHPAAFDNARAVVEKLQSNGLTIQAPHQSSTPI